MTISNTTLIKIASIGGVITCSMGLLLHKKVSDNVRDQEFYKEAFKTLRTHRGAVTLLGEPIKEGRLDVGSSDNHYDSLNAHFQVPVKGPNQKGRMYFWADRKTVEDKWRVRRIELALKNEPDRRLLVKNIECTNVEG